MTTAVLFRGMDPADHLIEHINSVANSLIGDFDGQGTMELSVVVGKSAGRSDTHAPIFECHIILKGGVAPEVLFVKKESKSFYQAVRKSLHALREQLKRLHGKRSVGRRHPRWELPNVNADASREVAAYEASLQ